MDHGVLISIYYNVVCYRTGNPRCSCSLRNSERSCRVRETKADTGRHVFEDKVNEYVMEHYDYTGYHFHYSPMACFLNGTRWVEQESRYVDNPDDAFAVRKLKGFCGKSDKLVWDGKPIER